MGLFEEIVSATQKIDICKFAKWLQEQKPDYQKEILDVLASDFPTHTIWRVLSDRHSRFASSDVLARHRSGKCCCESSR